MRPSPASSATLTVSDFGINQWTDSLQLGADFSHAKNRVLHGLSPHAQILVPMFPYEVMASTNPDVLRAQIFNILKTRVDQGLAKGVTNFEIQLVELIGTLGYADSAGQGLVDHFGAAAYGAVADLTQYLESKHIDVYNRAIVGSNGTKMFAASLNQWMHNGKAIWDAVDMFDGRAYLEPMKKVITAIGAGKIRLFNTLGDLPGPHIPNTSVKSIANFDTNKELKQLFPELQVFLLSPLDPKLHLWFAGAHVSGMARPHEVYTIHEFQGREQGFSTLPGVVLGQDIRPGVILSDHVYQRALFSPEAEERIAVSRDVATHLAEGVLAVGKALKENPEWKTRFGDLMKRDSGALTKHESALLGVLGTIKALAEPIQKDIDESGRGHVVWFRTHTFEQIATLLLDKAPQLIYDTWAKGKRDIPLADRARMSMHLRQVEGLRELTIALSHASMTGQLDKDSRTHLLDGIQALMSVHKSLHAQVLVMDGIQEVLDGVTYEGAGGATSLAAYQHYADAYINFFWTGVGIRTCGPNGACVEAIKGLGVGFSQFMGSRVYASSQALFNLGNISKSLTEYETIVTRAIASGRPAPKLVDVYGLQLLREMGVDYKTIAESDARIDDMNQKLEAKGIISINRPGSTDPKKAATPLPSLNERRTSSAPIANPSDPNVGGVITDVVIETEQADLRKKREAVLKAIRRGQLATDLPTQK